MPAFAVVRLAERQGLPPDPESNALLDSFVVHVRCLRDFLWRARGDGYRTDAFAADFCEADDWRPAGETSGRRCSSWTAGSVWAASWPI